MAAPKKREEGEHKYLARIALGSWQKIQEFAEEKAISLNDAVNEILDAGIKRKKL
jgi:hypothetical protein